MDKVATPLRQLWAKVRMKQASPAQLDFLIRSKIRQEARQTEFVHPAWTSRENSGLYQGMVDLADHMLRNRPSRSGEDLVMDIFAQDAKLLIVVGKHMDTIQGIWYSHPLSFIKPPHQLWKFFTRKIRNVLRGEKHRSIAENQEVAITQDQPFWEFMAWVVRQESPVGRKLVSDMRNLANKSEFAQYIVNLLKEGKGLKYLHSMAQDMGRSGFGGLVRTVKDKFIPSVRQLVMDDPSYMEIYDEWVERFNPPQ